MPPGTRYATLGTPMGIILISFLMDDRIDALLLRPVTNLGAGELIPFFGTNVDTDIQKEDNKTQQFQLLVSERESQKLGCCVEPDGDGRGPLTKYERCENSPRGHETAEILP